MSRINASATSVITRALRARCFPSAPPVALRVPDLSAVFRSTCDACQAGTRPKMMPVASESRRVKPSTTPSRRIVLTRGMFCGTAATRASVPHCAMSKPSNPPSPARSTLSVSNCRIIRPRFAPRAARNAISFPRTDARASIRLATFAFAISSRQATAPNKT